MKSFEEIERRFIVDGRDEKPWRVNSTSSQIQQFYFGKKALHVKNQTLLMGDIQLISLSPEELELWNSRTDWGGRLRIRDGTNIITCKSRKSRETAFELEWAVSPEVGEAINSLGPYPSVEKTRYVWTGPDGGKWEVDEFESPLEGLIIAEVELESEDRAVIIPSWAGLELTSLRGWSNAALARMLNDAMLP